MQPESRERPRRFHEAERDYESHRLAAVRDRVEQLVRSRPGLADEMRRAFQDFVALRKEYLARRPPRSMERGSPSPAIETGPDPFTIDPDDLRRFNDAEYRTIVLYRLGGLADAAALRPIVPRPPSMENSEASLEDRATCALWVARLPLAAGHVGREPAALSPKAFSPVVAEQMLEDLESWGGPRAADRPLSEAGEPPPLDDQPPALTKVEQRVLQTMSDFSPEVLVSSLAVHEAMDPVKRISVRTIGPAVARLAALQLAERPAGDRSGARLTIKGRKLASKIAD